LSLPFGLVKVAQPSGKPQLVGNRYLLCSAADSPTTLLGIMHRGERPTTVSPPS